MTANLFHNAGKAARWANSAFYYNCKLCKRRLDGGDYFVTPKGLFVICAGCRARYNIIFGVDTLELYKVE